MSFKQFYIEAQEFTSKDTSIAQVAALHNELLKLGIFQDGQIVLDWGGGKYDMTKDKIESEKKLNFYIHDEFNRSPEHNKEVELEVLNKGGADIITIANVLNVIKEKSERIKTLQKAKKFLKSNGKVYISVYNAVRTPNYTETNEYVGQSTSKGWQNAQPLSFYLSEVQQVFSNVRKKGSMIIAQN